MADRNNPILHNFWWKLLSLLLAALTWLTIQTILHKDQAESAQSPVVTVNSRTFTDVPVTLMTMAYNTNRFRINPMTVTVVVTGNVDDLNQLPAREISAFVDVSRSRDEPLVMEDIQVHAPPKFNVARVIPGMASVERLPIQKP